MAVALEVRVCDLLTEFLADALVILRAFQTAGAITAGALQTFPDSLYHLLILIQPNSHAITSFRYYYKSWALNVNSYPSVFL